MERERRTRSQKPVLGVNFVADRLLPKGAPNAPLLLEAAITVYNNSSGYWGVYRNRHSHTHPYDAKPRAGGKCVYLGSFTTAREAGAIAATYRVRPETVLVPDVPTKMPPTPAPARPLALAFDASAEVLPELMPDIPVILDEKEEEEEEEKADTGAARKGPWSKEEDKRLMRVAQKCKGPKMFWRRIAESMQGRSGKQCRERYVNHLQPGIKHSEWTPEEDRTIYESYLELGRKWSDIARRLPGRTDNAVKNRYNTYIHAANFEDLDVSCMENQLFKTRLVVSQAVQVKSGRAGVEGEWLDKHGARHTGNAPGHNQGVRWSAEETARLRDAVQEGTPPPSIDWNVVALLVGTRNAAACRRQWERYHPVSVAHPDKSVRDATKACTFKFVGYDTDPNPAPDQASKLLCDETITESDAVYTFFPRTFLYSTTIGCGIFQERTEVGFKFAQVRQSQKRAQNLTETIHAPVAKKARARSPSQPKDLSLSMLMDSLPCPEEPLETQCSSVTAYFPGVKPRADDTAWLEKIVCA